MTKRQTIGKMKSGDVYIILVTLELLKMMNKRNHRKFKETLTLHQLN